MTPLLFLLLSIAWVGFFIFASLQNHDGGCSDDKNDSQYYSDQGFFGGEEGIAVGKDDGPLLFFRI